MYARVTCDQCGAEFTMARDIRNLPNPFVTICINCEKQLLVVIKKNGVTNIQPPRKL